MACASGTPHPVALFELVLDAGLISIPAATYPQVSGRDFKGLARLVAKTCRHRVRALSLALFAHGAMFRALDPAATPQG